MEVDGDAYGVAEADEGRSVSGRDGAERDGGGAGFAEAAGDGSDGLAEVALQKHEGVEADGEPCAGLRRGPNGDQELARGPESSSLG